MASMGVSPAGLERLRPLFPHVRELAIVAAAYCIYMLTRAVAFDDFGATAMSNAGTIISLETSLGFFWEPEWQSWAISSAKALVIFFNWAYIVTFFPILLTTGVILYVVNRNRYRYYRNVVLISFILAILGFMLFPLAPPRMMADHFVDTIKAFGPAFYASREFGSFYNPYAAMPSLHFSWTVLFSVLFLRTHNKWLNIFGIIYPAITLLAITITANHYIMDAIGGTVLIFAAFATMEIVCRRRLFLPQIGGNLRALTWRSHIPFVRRSGPNGTSAREVGPVTMEGAAKIRQDGNAPTNRHGNAPR